MSHNPSERDDDSPTPGGAGNPWLRFLAGAMLALVLYVLSIGPAWWLVCHGYLSIDKTVPIYFPLGYLPPDLINMLAVYVNLWAPVRL